MNQFIQVLANILPKNGFSLKLNKDFLNQQPKAKVCSITLVAMSKFAKLERNMALRQHKLLIDKMYNKLNVDMMHMNLQFSLNELFGIKIGENVLVGAGSVVIKDVPNNVKAFGSPAKVKSDMMRLRGGGQ